MLIDSLYTLYYNHIHPSQGSTFNYPKLPSLLNNQVDKNWLAIAYLKDFEKKDKKTKRNVFVLAPTWIRACSPQTNYGYVILRRRISFEYK